MNIDFEHHAGFSAYALLLVFSGIVMLVAGSPVVRSSSTGLRVLNVLFGVGFVGYGCYLAFLFHGGTYFVFFKAFIVPVLLLVRTVRGARARAAAAPAPVTPTAQWAQPEWAQPQYQPPQQYQAPQYQPPQQYQAPQYQPPQYPPPAAPPAPPAPPGVDTVAPPRPSPKPLPGHD